MQVKWYQESPPKHPPLWRKCCSFIHLGGCSEAKTTIEYKKNMQEWHGGMEWQLPTHSSTWSICTLTSPSPWGSLCTAKDEGRRKAQRHGCPCRQILLPQGSTSRAEMQHAFTTNINHCRAPSHILGCNSKKQGPERHCQEQEQGLIEACRPAHDSPHGVYTSVQGLP